ncbi:hypothetical protein ACF0H5_022152 [Mactra antiquata]
MNLNVHYNCFTFHEKDNITEYISSHCKLEQNGNIMITLKTATDAPTYLYFAVHNGSMIVEDPLSSGKTFCRDHFTSTKESTTCPTTTIPTCPPCTTTPETATKTTYLSYYSTTNDNKGTYDAAKEHCNQSTEICILQIVIASIASFIAGIVVCLLVLCLLRHCRERLCVQTTTPDASLSKSNKVKEPNEELKTPPQMKPIPEDRDLQAVNPEYIMDIGTVRPQQSAPKQVPLLEMSDKRRSDHIYSEIGNKQTNASNVYESTFQNRLSDHVYQGIPDNRLQTHKCTENRRIDETHTIDTMESGGMNAKLMSETDPCYTEGHDYFTLEKGSYSVNDQETGDETKSMKQVDVNPQPDPNGCYTQHHGYFILEKVNNAITEPGSSVDFKSNEPGNMNANAQLEPDGC